jgi:hypothetical protein
MSLLAPLRNTRLTFGSRSRLSNCRRLSLGTFVPIVSYATRHLQGSKTHANLKAAFAGEAMAKRRKNYFSQKADLEGLPDISALLMITAEVATGQAV